MSQIYLFHLIGVVSRVKGCFTYTTTDSKIVGETCQIAVETQGYIRG